MGVELFAVLLTGQHAIMRSLFYVIILSFKIVTIANQEKTSMCMIRLLPTFLGGQNNKAIEIT